ncbi:MAG: serine kinase [Rhodobacteraceae bacterium]|nr:serine kinase [Paracoccaceae bacterium]
MSRPDIISQEIFHATTVAVAGTGLMITGPSGAGKSSLALQLMAWGADLVADDRTLLRERSDGAIEALAPPTLPPRIEARGVGLLPAKLSGPVRLGAVVSLSSAVTARLPEPAHCMILGQKVTLIHKSETAHFASAVLQYMKGTFGSSP